MADITTDPFTAVEGQIQGLLTDSSDFTKDVKAGNRIRYVGGFRDPEKEEVASADFPEVRIIAGGMAPHIENTSNSSRMITKYMIEVRTGTKVLDKTHYPLIWAVFKAMTKWKLRMDTLTIAENASGTFVILVRPIGETTEGIERGEISKGIEGWFAIWTIEVDMFFATSNLN